MKKSLTICFALIVCFSFQGFGQFIYENSSNSFNFLEKKEISKDTLIQIIKAEDELRFDRTLEDLLKSEDPQILGRAALAAGRIGDERAVPALAKILNDLTDPEVMAMAAFALGEIESISGADAVLSALKDDKIQSSVRARAVEAAGKIAAANPKEEKSKTLGEAILDGLEMEDRRGSKQSKEFVLLGLTAALRAKPDEADYVVAKFLTNLDARIRADAANALARLRGKKANGKLRAMLLTDDAPIARANAARALGAAGDKDSVNILIEAAATDEDLRVRINAIRALGGLKSEKAADRLLERAGKLFDGYKKSEYENPSEENELLTITVALGNILKGTENERALKFLTEFLKADPTITFSPKYVDDKLTLSEKAFYEIFDSEGNQISSGTGRVIKLKKLDPGTYQIFIEGIKDEFYKR